MAHNKLNVSLASGGLGRTVPSTDGVMACVMNAIAVTGGLQLNTAYEFKSETELEALLVDAAYDTSNNVLVHHRIKRFFRKNQGATLHVMFVAQSVTMTDMLDISNDYAKKLSVDQAGAIKMIWVARNPPTGYTPVVDDGIDADVLTAIPKGQELVTDEFSRFRYDAVVLIEGRSMSSTHGDLPDLHDLAAKYPNVSVVGLADPAISAKHALFNGYAAVEDVARLLSFAPVSRNIGENADVFNLNDAAQGVFDTVGFSCNSTLNETSIDAVHAKGFIIGEAVPGLQGFYLNDTFTCTDLASDYAYIENNRTIFKALNLARLALLPKVNSRLYVDSVTGKLGDTDRSGLEDTAVDAINRVMLRDRDISGGTEAFIDPNTNVLADENIEVQVSFIPVAIGRRISLKIGFKNPFKTT